MPYFKHDSINFYYEDDNNEGYPLIFLHGLGGTTKQPLGVLKEIEGIRRISIDFRGHGKTIEYGSEDKLSFDQFADDVLALVKYLNLYTFHIGGISTGAGVALNLTLRYPERVNMLILSRVAWLDHKQDDLIRDAFGTVHTILHNGIDKDVKEQYKETEVYKELKKISEYAASTLLTQFDYEYAKEASLKLVKIPNDAPNKDRADWDNIKNQTLILAAKNDPIHPFEYGLELSKHIKNSEFIEITPKDVSYELHDKDSRDAIIKFLK